MSTPAAGSSVAGSPASGPSAGSGGRTGVIALIVAGAVSVVGTRISFIALPWLVLVTTHDPVRMGIVTGAASLPYVLNGFIASPLVDRIGARRISIISDVASAILMATVALVYNGGILVIAVLVAVAGSFRGVGDRAKNTMLKPMMDASDMDTVRVTSAYAGVNQLAQLLGGSIAGVLIAVFNPWGAIWIDVASFMVCALIVASMVFMPKPAPPPLVGVDGVYTSAVAKPPPAEPYLEQLRDGFRFLRSDRLISSMVSMLFVTNLFAQVGTAAFIPLWIDSRLDHSPIALGWIGGAYALGGIAGNAVFTALATKLPRYKTFVVGYFLGGAPRFLVLAFSHNLAVVVAVWAFAGFALSSANPTIGAVMYNRVPFKLLARVGSLSSAIAFAGFSIGGLVGGFSVEQMGFTAAVIFASTVYFCATLTPVAGHSTWRLIDTVTKSARQLAADTSIRIRLVLSNHQWTATAQGRDGADLVRSHPVHDGDVAYALGLIGPPALRPLTRQMLDREHTLALEREQRLRAELDASERRLERIEAVADATHDSAYLDAEQVTGANVDDVYVGHAQVGPAQVEPPPVEPPTGTVYRTGMLNGSVNASLNGVAHPGASGAIPHQIDLPADGIDAVDAEVEAEIVSETHAAFEVEDETHAAVEMEASPEDAIAARHGGRDGD